MSISWRANLLVIGIGVFLIAGCDKKDSGGTPAPGASSALPKADAALYSKKLIGTWEATEEVGGKAQTITAEFKSDGGFKIDLGPFDMKGTWKLVKEEGKTVTISTEATIDAFGDEKAPPKSIKQTLVAVFEDANTVVISNEGDKPDPKKFKRKS